LFQTHVHVGTGWTEKKCLDLVFAVAVEAYECNVIHLNGEVAMAKLTARHANSCIYMLTQEKEFGVLCTNFTVHNLISNYDCFIILKYGFLIHMMETILTRICHSSQIAVTSICKPATLFVLSFGFYIACLKWWRAKGLYRSESSSDPHILASFLQCVDMGAYPLEGKNGHEMTVGLLLANMEVIFLASCP
jgi:hypothetical protein